MVECSPELSSWEIIEEDKVQSVGSGEELGNDSIESHVRDSYVFIPKSLTFAEVTSILSKAIKENSFEELDNFIQNTENYEGLPVKLNHEDFKNFCLNQLNLDLQNGSDHHIYSNILLQYNFDQSKLEYNYPVKELILLAIAANNSWQKDTKTHFLLEKT